MGHMQPPPGAALTLAGLRLSSPVGLSGELDPWLLGTRALAQFGFGVLEIGPVTVDPSPEHVGPCLDPKTGAIVLADEPIGPGLEATRRRLQGLGQPRLPLLIRITSTPGTALPECDAQLEVLAQALGPWAAAFVLETRWSTTTPTRQIETVRRCSDVPILMALAPDLESEQLAHIVKAGTAANVDGWVVSGGVRTPPGPKRLVGRPTRCQVLDTVCRIRQQVGPNTPLIAEGGVEAPADALALRNAGADVVLLLSGLVIAGPGLPKRINEAVAAAPQPTMATPRAWLPFFLLGMGMLVGGALAWLVAIVRVALPYDEAFLGIGLDQLASINPRLLSFMAHNRVTLAGTMLSIGVLYAQLGLWGVRAGAHWAWQAVVLSAAVGFASFFLFLGFGYFDPLHAAVSVVLLVVFLAGLRGRPVTGETSHATPGLLNDWRWRVGLWGQLCFVGLGGGLVLAGLMIALIGIGGVLVPEDVHYLDSPAALLQAANPRLLAVVAHDRAGFGGALVSAGLAVLLTSLWGFQSGARWVWWALFGSGAAGFGAAIGVHVAVGYLEVAHLAPAIVGTSIFVLALALSYPFLCQRQRSLGHSD